MNRIGIPEEKQDTIIKYLQYLMLFVMIAAAIILPGYSMKKQSNKMISGSAVREADGKAHNTKGMIVLDAGHGGEDPGMIGYDGIKEKDINLACAKKLKELLNGEGYSVVLTREEDISLGENNQSHKKARDMQKRIEIIRKETPLLSVSIHQNGYPQDSSVSGPQVFYYEHSVEGRTLAERIQEAMNTGLQVKRPRIAKGNTSYYILKRSTGPTVIVECGFLTNPQEAEKLRQEEYQSQIAQTIMDGILNYLAGTSSSD